MRPDLFGEGIPIRTRRIATSIPNEAGLLIAGDWEAWTQPKPRYSQDVAGRGVGKRISGFVTWTLAPVFAGAAVSVLGFAIQAFPENAEVLRSWALGLAVALGVFSAAKAVRDFVRERSAEQLRYSAIEELHNKLGPALDLTAELAAIDPGERDARDALLKQIATQCCSALVAMTPAVKDVRAVIYQFNASDEILPLASFGRRDAPRTFSLADAQGREILDYISGGELEPELFPDTKRKAPEHYVGDRRRYRTFIRARIWTSDAAYGMVAVDAPKKKSLTKGDRLLAALVASQLAIAFAIAANEPTGSSGA